MIKVLIVDDQVLLRESLGYILESDNEIKVVGMVGDGEKAIKYCQNNNPDVVLMDIEMPNIDGVNATKKIKEKFNNIKVIILTTFENQENVMESFIAGADGYVVKSVNHKELVLSVKCVASGLNVIHDSVKKIIVDRFKGVHDYKSKYADKLTDLDIEIIKLVANGKSNKEIGNSLSYSEGTIKNKISKIFEKLQLSDRMQIAIFAIENGII